MSGRLADWFRSCNWWLTCFMWTFTKTQIYFNRQVLWILGWNVWQFVHVIGFCLYSFTFIVCSTWLMMLNFWICCNEHKCHSVETRSGFYPFDNSRDFRDRRSLVPSRTHQTSWCTNQGTQDGHIPLPKRKLQPVCYWQPKDYRNHPEIKCTCSKIHNNLCPLVLHKELKIRADGWAYMQQK